MLLDPVTYDRKFVEYLLLSINKKKGLPGNCTSINRKSIKTYTKFTNTIPITFIERDKIRLTTKIVVFYMD